MPSTRAAPATLANAQTRRLRRLACACPARIVGQNSHPGLAHMAINVATNDGAALARNAAATAASARILRLPQVCAVTGFGRSMIYQMEAEGRFPNRINIGVRAV